MTLARRMAGFTESPTLRVSTIARTLRAQGRDVVDFRSGEPDLIPQNISNTRPSKPCAGWFTKYTNSFGHR